MNKTKGFIGLGLILAIVLGVVVVGGGAYYLGKSSTKPVVINPENTLPNVENQNLPVVDNSKQANITTPKINSAPVKTISTTSCTSDKGKVMTYSEALEISKTSSCNSVGKFTGEYACNKNSGGLVDVYMKPSNTSNCGFACRVSIDTGITEEGWMCTGAL